MKFIAFVFCLFATIAFTDETQDAILKRYLKEGDVALLEPLLSKSTPSEISERLKSIATSKPITKFGESFVIAESSPKVMYDNVAAVVDLSGITHIVISEIKPVSERSDLGSQERWQTR